MEGKDFLSIQDVSNGDVMSLIEKSIHMKREGSPQILKGKNIALLFEKPSLRTRVSFEVGITQMGGNCILGLLIFPKTQFRVLQSGASFLRVPIFVCNLSPT